LTDALRSIRSFSKFKINAIISSELYSPKTLSIFCDDYFKGDDVS
jgi:hypothetical protein